MAGRRAAVSHRTAVLAAIARREWLLQMLSLTAAGCRRGPDRVPSHASTMTIAYWGGQQAFSPYADESAKFLLFLPLVITDAQGRLEGRLAERWEHSADYREWIYHLRPGVKWHDGVPVTAHDVEFSERLFAETGNGFGPGAAVTAIDDSTVRIRYTTDDPARLHGWTVYYPRHLLKDLDPARWADWEFWRHPIGNGPYRFVQHVEQTATVLEANPDFFGRKPGVNRLVLKFGDYGSRPVTELLSGQVDLMPEVDAALWQRLQSDQRFRIHYSYAAARSCLYWHNDHPLFRDIRVRRALTLAINRRELLDVVNYPATTPIIDGPYTNRQLQRGHLPEPLPYDPAQAGALLDASGWRDRDGDGIRQRAGRPFRFTALVHTGGPGTVRAAVYVQSQLQAVGIRMELQPRSDVLDQMKRGAFEAAVFPFLPRRMAWYEDLFGSNAPTGYENPALMELVQRLKASADPDEIGRIQDEIVEIFRRDLPVTFLFPSLLTSFAHRRIGGLDNPWIELFAKPEDLWIDE